MSYETQPQPQPPAGSPTGYRGQPGEPRAVGLGILLFVVTFGIYGLYWAYMTAEEMKRYANVGVGGVVQLIIWFFISPVSGFLIPNDIEALYRSEGEQSPVTAMTGLWLFPGIFIIVGPIIWYVKVQNALNDFWSRRRDLGAAPAAGSWGAPPPPPPAG